MPISSLLLVTGSPETEKVVEAAVGRCGLPDLPIYSGSMQSILSGLMTERPDAVLIDATQIPSPSPDLVGQLIAKFPGAAVVFLGVPTSGQEVIQLASMGVQHFLPWPLRDDALFKLLQPYASQPAGSNSKTAPQANKTVTIITAKGGSGATLVTANLGVSLAQRHPGKVLALDIASQCGDLSTYLDLVPKFTLRNLIEQHDRVDDQYFASLIQKHASGLHVLPGPRLDQEPLNSLHLHELENVLRQLQKRYPFILIDPGACDTGLLQTAVAHSTSIILLGSLDIPSLKGLTVLYQKVLRWGCLPHQVKLVLNRFNSKNQLGMSAFEKNIGQKISLMLPNQYSTCIESINTGKPLNQLEPRSDLTRKLDELARLIETAPGTLDDMSGRGGRLTDKIAGLFSGKDR